jgi:signal peptidase I
MRPPGADGLESSRLELRVLPREAARALAGDRARAAEAIGAELHPEWPLPDLLDVLPAHLALADEDLPFGVWVIVERSSNMVVGDVGFHGPPTADGTVEIGYSVVPSRRRRGYATTGARTLLDWASQQPRVRRIVAGCLADNGPSIRTLDRLGFVQDGERDGELRWVLADATDTEEPATPQRPTSRPSPGSDSTASPASPKRRARGCLFEIVETMVLTVVIFLGVQTFIAQPFRIEGGSMETTLLPDQYVLIDKLTPHWAPYARGDIVVLDPPSTADDPTGTPFIKRVIGLAGDRIELRDGIVFVNGTALDEPYIYEDNGVPQRTDPTGGGLQWLVPAGDLFVLGDHRENSSDSRVFGPIEISHVVGRAWLRYWPVGAFGILTGP